LICHAPSPPVRQANARLNSDAYPLPFATVSFHFPQLKDTPNTLDRLEPLVGPHRRESHRVVRLQSAWSRWVFGPLAAHQSPTHPNPPKSSWLMYAEWA